jgi:hypothetical protein
VIPLVVAFVGAALGSYVTISTNSETIQAERDRAIDQFRRDQRRDQYAAILQQATRLQNASTFSSTAVGALGLPASALGLAMGGITAKTSPGSPAEPRNPSTTTGTGASDLDRAVGAEIDAQNNLEMIKGVQELGLSGLGDIRDTWQSAYTGLDQAISNSEIASSRPVIVVARALRDKYRNDYYQSVLKQIDATISFYPDPKPDRLKLAEALVGVPADQGPPTYDVALLTKSTDELTTMYVQAAKSDLGLDDR